MRESIWCNQCLISPNCPPFRSTRLILGNLAAWAHGSCIVYPSEIFHPPSIVDAVSNLRCTALHGVPTHFIGVLKEVEKRRQEGHTIDLSSLRYFRDPPIPCPRLISTDMQYRTGIAAGSPIPIELMNQLMSKMNLTDLTIAYGMS